MAGLYVYIKRVKKRFSAEAKNIPAQCFLPRKTHQRTCSVAYVIHTSGAHKRYTLSMRTMYIVYIVYMYIHKTTSPSIAQLLHSFAAVHYSYTHTHILPCPTLCLLLLLNHRQQLLAILHSQQVDLKLPIAKHRHFDRVAVLFILDLRHNVLVKNHSVQALRTQH